MSQAATAANSLCWSCKGELHAEPLCPHCVKIQPLGRNSDYFSVMGLPRKLGIDGRVLEPLFHALSRRFHPDVYRLGTARERMIALENSAVLNQAYRTLRDPFERAAYLADLELGRETGSPEHTPHALFDAILEVQESLAEFRAAEVGEQAVLRPALCAQRNALRAEQTARGNQLTDELFQRWDGLPPAAPERGSVLREIRRLLGERSYLRRVLAGLDAGLDARPESGPAPGAAVEGPTP